MTHTLKILFISSLFMLLYACASTFDQAETYAIQNEWLKAVLEYRKALAENPGDVEIKSRLKQAELSAASYYYQSGSSKLNKNQLDEAIVLFQQGLIAMPEYSKLQSAMKNVLQRRDADSLYKEALANHDIGKHDDAIVLLQKALSKFPEHKEALQLLNEYQLDLSLENKDQLALKSKDPVTLNFKSTDIKTAFNFVVSSFGVNVIFDEGIKNTQVTLYAQNVTFEQAISLLVSTSKTFYKRIGTNTILVAPDTPDKRGQYEDHIIRTFDLKTVLAKDMANILKSVLGIKKIIINESLNTIIIRDTKELIELSEKLIRVNDKKSAELILDVEILEVNRTKAEQLGLDFGSQIGISYPTFTGSASNALSAGVVTLPSLTFRFFKQDVDAKTLANPKIRVLDNKKAKIHIGDRVPLRSATIQDATGQTRTTFEYKDIGIRLQVEPDIHLDNSVTVKLNLEVSSLGQNLGTAQEPAFSIGTRNADTFMLLKDGETAILGGLIRDEDRRAKQKVPGFGDIPIIGALFTSFDGSTTRTDVLLTITPHVIRSTEVATKQLHSIYSGTEKSYTTKPLFDFLNTKTSKKGETKIKVGKESSKATNVLRDIPTKDLKISTNEMSKLGVLSFEKPIYEINKNDEFTINVFAENVEQAQSLPLAVLFNSNLIEIIDVTSTVADISKIESPDAMGQYQFSLNNLRVPSNDNQVVATIKVRSKQQGISYLIFKKLLYKTKTSETLSANIRASRVVIR